MMHSNFGLLCGHNLSIVHHHSMSSKRIRTPVVPWTPINNFPHFIIPVFTRNAAIMLFNNLNLKINNDFFCCCYDMQFKLICIVDIIMTDILSLCAIKFRTFGEHKNVSSWIQRWMPV